MAMSVAHRITGAANYFGALLLAIWLVAMASGPEAYATAQAFFGSMIGQLLLLGYTWSLMHHMLGGVRHLLWDFGYGMERDTRINLSRFTLIGSILLTLLIWITAAIVL